MAETVYFGGSRRNCGDLLREQLAALLENLTKARDNRDCHPLGLLVESRLYLSQMVTYGIGHELTDRLGKELVNAGCLAAG